MRMVRECLRGAVMLSASTIEYNMMSFLVSVIPLVVMALVFPRLSERDHLGVLAHPANPLGFHLLFRDFLVAGSVLANPPGRGRSKIRTKNFFIVEVVMISPFLQACLIDEK